MGKLSLKAKFLALLAVVVLGAVVTVVFVSHRLAQFQTQFDVFYRTGVLLEQKTLEVARDTNYVSRLTRSIMLGDSLDKNLAALDKTLAELGSSFDAMAQAAQALEPASQRAGISALVGAARQDTLMFAQDARQRMANLQALDARTPEVLAAAWADYRQAATPVANQARESFKALADAARDHQQAAREATAASVQQLQRLMTIMIVVVVAVIMVFGIYLMRSVVRPLEQAVAIAGRVAEGNLSGRIEVVGEDETGRLLQAMQRMQERLTEMVRQLQLASGVVAKTSNGLVETARTVRLHAVRQSEATGEMAASMQEMTASVGHMADQAQASNAHAAGAQHTAADAGRVVGSARAEIAALAELVGQAVSTIETLDRRSGEISKIVGVIKEIADQTNLLALNAAIEAARAGEQGRGFAVVADEVRKLAERTGQSTQEISQMLSAVQQATRQVVEEMTASAGAVQRGVVQTEQAEQHMQKIGDGAAQMVAVVAEISTALRAQSQASNLVAQNVDQITQMTEKTSAEIDRIAAAASELDQVAAQLGETVSIFRVSGER